MSKLLQEQSESTSPIFRHETKNLGVRATRAVLWAGAGSIAAQVINLIVMAVLARLLLPQDFGLIAMTMVFITFANLFAELGLSSAVIQRAELTESMLSSAFWLNVICGIVITAIFVVIAPLVGRFYGQPQLTTIAYFLALTFTIGALGTAHNAILRRNLHFKALTAIGISSAVVSGICAVTMALAGFGVWSLVAKALVGAGMISGLSWLATGWRPNLTMSRSAIRPLLAFSMPVLGLGLLTLVRIQSDRLLLGKLGGPAQLGYYGLAYTLMLLPLSQVVGTLSGVAFPTFSAIQHQVDKVGTNYLRLLRTIALWVFPFMTGVIFLAPIGVPVLLGEKWQPAIIPVQILAAAGMFRALYSTVGLSFRALGKPKLELKLFLLITPVALMLFALGVRWGAIGMSIAYLVYNIVAAPAALKMALELVGRRLRDLMRSLVTPALLSLIVALALFVSKHMLVLIAGLPDEAFTTLLVLVLIATAAYFIGGLLLARKDVASLVQLARLAFSHSSSHC